MVWKAAYMNTPSAVIAGFLLHCTGELCYLKRFAQQFHVCSSQNRKIVIAWKFGLSTKNGLQYVSCAGDTKSARGMVHGSGRKVAALDEDIVSWKLPTSDAMFLCDSILALDLECILFDLRSQSPGIYKPPRCPASQDLYTVR
jgi:hypothetical protein